MAVKFNLIFPIQKPIIGMIHLAGSDRKEKVRRALEELAIYESEGVDGAIIEDYHGYVFDVLETLKESDRNKLKIVRGVNILRNPYLAFDLASLHGARFVQFDSVQMQDLDLKKYKQNRNLNPKIIVLGGVGFKYTRETGNPLEIDLREGKEMCEAIVTTGSGTGIETPIEKLKEFRRYLNNFPLIVGAGINAQNIYEQLSIADGAIIGSYFKPRGDTQLPVERERVRDLMDIVRAIRN